MSTPPRKPTVSKNCIEQLNRPVKKIKRSDLIDSDPSSVYCDKFHHICFLNDLLATTGNIQSDQFKILQHIGSGSFSNVYLVETVDSSLKHDDSDKFALKCQYYSPKYTFYLNMSQHWLILQKIKAYGMNHLPGLLPMLHAWCEIDDLKKEERYPEVCYFLMRYSSKGTLKDKNFTENDIWKLLYDLSRTISQLSNLALLHNDIKPDNIMEFDEESKGTYRFQLADWGHMIDLELISNTSKLNDEGDAHFLAPEMLEENKAITAAVDIFALGKTCLNLLSLEKMLNQELKELVQSMIHENPSCRPSAKIVETSSFSNLC
jgi:serine/threonine protein kinase